MPLVVNTKSKNKKPFFVSDAIWNNEEKRRWLGKDLVEVEPVEKPVTAEEVIESKEVQEESNKETETIENTTDYSQLSLKELRDLFPEVSARSKGDFLNQIK